MSGCQKPRMLEFPQKETSHGDENIWYLYFGDGYKTLHIFQNTQNCITKNS